MNRSTRLQAVLAVAVPTFALLGAAACGPTSKATPIVEPPATPATTGAGAAAPAAARPLPAAPELRLPALARPTGYDVELTLEPSSEDFTGRIVISMELLRDTDLVWLNAAEITPRSATLVVGPAGQPVAVVATPVGKDFMAVQFPAVVKKGPATLTIEYAGKSTKDDGDGIYTAKEGDDFYLYTQFEATDARAAFPCFDEPNHKVPWKLAIRAKKELVVLANTPVEKETEEPGGWKLVEFQRTKPLPSYLVAFAVGPFDIVEAGKSRTGVPIRIVVSRGRAAEAAYPAKVTHEVLAVAEDYFGTPYPYEKLDIIGCAVFNAGAMENPGLITFRQSIVLSKPEELTLGRQKRYAIVLAHEIAHQWFGDLVTMAWWDDIWLNEAFASWMEEKITLKWKPEWDAEVGMVRARSGVMKQDGLESARSIRNPIKTESDIGAAFDGITYQKGQAVLFMLERWVGEETFAKGVRLYMQRHAWGNATYEDFVAAITEAAGQDVRAPYDSFVLQSGVPIVKFDLKCDKGQAPALTLSQSRYAPVGAKVDQNRKWTMPVCVRWGAGKQVGRDCTVLSAPSADLALTAPSCPDWVLPNDRYDGYYRAHLGGDLLDRLVKKGAGKLTAAERVGLLGDVDALVDSGTLPQATALGLVDLFSKDGSAHVVASSLGVIEGIREYVPDALLPNYERYVRKLFGKTARKLGWKTVPGEEQEITSLRPRVLSLVAIEGNDPQLVKEATALAWKWLDDKKAVDPELVDVVLDIAAVHGDEKLFERLYGEAKAAKDRGERGRLLGAMGSFTKPELVRRTFAIVVAGEFELRESFGLTRGAYANPSTRPLALSLFEENIDKISDKLPGPYRRYMAFTLASYCDDSKKASLEAKYKERFAKLDGGERAFTQAMEQLSLCAAQKAAQTPGVSAFLKKQ